MQSKLTFVASAVLMAFGALPVAALQRGNPHATPPAAAHPASAATSHATPTVHPPANVPVQIAGNPALVARLQPLLPAGLTLAEAAAGFKNQGQFIAALHVSQNLSIPFANLKTQITGPSHASLGQAIHTLKPSANADTVSVAAQKAADEDVKAANVPGAHAASTKTSSGSTRQ